MYSDATDFPDFFFLFLRDVRRPSFPLFIERASDDIYFLSKVSPSGSDLIFPSLIQFFSVVGETERIRQTSARPSVVFLSFFIVSKMDSWSSGTTMTDLSSMGLTAEDGICHFPRTFFAPEILPSAQSASTRLLDIPNFAAAFVESIFNSSAGPFPNGNERFCLNYTLMAEKNQVRTERYIKYLRGRRDLVTRLGRRRFSLRGYWRIALFGERFIGEFKRADKAADVGRANVATYDTVLENDHVRRYVSVIFGVVFYFIGVPRNFLAAVPRQIESLLLLQFVVRSQDPVKL